MVDLVGDSATMLAQPEKPLPAALPWNTFTKVIDEYQKGGIPGIVTSVSLPDSVSRKLGARVVQGFRALGLIDQAGVVQPSFRRLVEARGGHMWQGVLRTLMDTAYPYVAGLDLLQTDTPKLHGAFSRYLGRPSENLSKCEAFYLNLARAAGHRLSEPLEKRVRTAEQMATIKAAQKTQSMPPRKLIIVPKRQPSVLARPEPPRNQEDDLMKPSVETASAPPPNLDPRFAGLIDLLDDEGMTDKERAALLTLMSYLKRQGKKGG